MEILNKGKGMLSSSEKLQLWDDLQILSFTRMVLSLWSVTMLSLYIRVYFLWICMGQLLLLWICCSQNTISAQRFRSMLQSRIDLSTVDVSYVSSRSWYFLILFGLRGLFSLNLGDENAIDDTQQMMQMGGFGFDASKSLGVEKDGLDIIQHEEQRSNT